jgi:putative intracellular protease/amidase
MMAAFNQATTSDMHMTMHDNRKVIAIVLYEEFEPLDAVGPLEVLGQLRGYKVVTVAKHKGPVASALGTQIVADYSFDELKNPAVIVVPGGLFGTIAASKDAETLAWIREADKTSEYTTSVCTGSWILGAAGVLNGRQASTHWTGEEYLEDLGVQYSNKRYTVDGKYVTGAGVSAGIDMSFKLIAILEGEDQAKVAQLGLEYDPQPPFDSGSSTKADPELVRIMRSMMVDHIAAAKSIPATPATMTASTTSMTDMTSMANGMHAHMATNVSAWPAIPTITAKAHPDTMGGWNLELVTTNFRFAPEHVGNAVLPSEGHAHLYIDGVKIGRIYGTWYNLPPTLFKSAGDHEIRVTLNANDHSDLESNGATIQSIVHVTSVH